MPVTASTNIEKSTISLAGVDAGAKMLVVGVAAWAGTAAAMHASMTARVRSAANELESVVRSM